MNKLVKFSFAAIILFIPFFLRVPLVSAASVANTSPMLTIDSPSSNYDSRVNSTVNISGWAMSPDGIAYIKVSIDGSQDPKLWAAMSGSSLYYRSDVQKAYPNYPNSSANRGFSVNFDINKICAGTHTAYITLTTNGGWVITKTKVFTVAKPSNEINIDTPLTGSFMTNTLSMSGWAINPSGVAAVDVLLDWKTIIGRATLGSDRSDVDAAYPSYPKQDISSFSLITNLNLGSLSNTNHTITVYVTGVDGSVKTQTITLTKKTFIGVDSPTPGRNYDSRVNSTVDVFGWALASDGVNNVTISIDGSTAPGLSASIAGSNLYARPDVQKAYGSMMGVPLNTGYLATFDINKIAPGNHTAYIRLTTNGGNTTTSSQSFTVSKPSNQINIDNPLTAAYMSGNMVINGWAINASTVKSVDVYINNSSIYLGSASLDPARSDVASAYPGYSRNQISTFELVTHPKLSNYTYDNYSLTVYETGMDGTKTSQTIMVQNVPPLVNIDTPTYGTPYQNYNASDNITVAGWAISPSTFTKVSVSADGSPVGATVSFNRPSADVYNTYPKYPGSDNSRYAVTIPPNTFTSGIHIITVTATDSVGVTSISKVAITIGSTSFTTNYNITLASMLSTQQTLLDNANLPSHPTVYPSDLNPDVVKSQYNGYEFMRLKYGGSNLTAAQLETMIPAMSNFGTADILSGHAKDFIDAASQYNINPLYLVAHARLETGNGGSKLAKGLNNSGEFIGYYDMYGCGAIDSDPVTGGDSVAEQYGWTSPRLAIIGGAQWISARYINAHADHGGYDQDTLYEMKWDPFALSTSQDPYEYATDPNWASSIAGIIYSNRGLIMSSNMTIVFDIPSYSN